MPKDGEILQLSKNTEVLTPVVRRYLASIGHQGTVVGDAVVFVRYENRRAVAAGPTRESVMVTTGPGGTAA